MGGAGLSGHPPSFASRGGGPKVFAPLAFAPHVHDIREQLRALSFLDGLTDTAYTSSHGSFSRPATSATSALFEEGAPREFLALVVERRGRDREAA